MFGVTLALGVHVESALYGIMDNHADINIPKDRNEVSPLLAEVMIPITRNFINNVAKIKIMLNYTMVLQISYSA